jgi:O-antigen ligase
MSAALTWKLLPRNRLLTVVMTVVMISALIAFAPSAYINRLLTTRDESAQTRTDDLKKSIYLAVRHPFVGVGMGNYALYSNREKDTHNSYTQVASEMGLAAAVIYLMFLVIPLRRLGKIQGASRRPASRRANYLAAGLQASLVGFMAASFFASVAYLWYVYYLVGFGVCLRGIAASRESVDVARRNSAVALD